MTNFEINLAPQEIQVVVEALNKEPFGKVETIMKKISMQVEAQAKAFVEKQQKQKEAARPAETKAKKNKKEEQCTTKK